MRISRIKKVSWQSNGKDKENFNKLWTARADQRPGRDHQIDLAPPTDRQPTGEPGERNGTIIDGQPELQLESLNSTEGKKGLYA